MLGETLEKELSGPETSGFLQLTQRTSRSPLEEQVGELWEETSNSRLDRLRDQQQ